MAKKVEGFEVDVNNGALFDMAIGAMRQSYDALEMSIKTTCRFINGAVSYVQQQDFLKRTATAYMECTNKHNRAIGKREIEYAGALKAVRNMTIQYFGRPTKEKKANGTTVYEYEWLKSDSPEAKEKRAARTPKRASSGKTLKTGVKAPAPAPVATIHADNWKADYLKMEAANHEMVKSVLKPSQIAALDSAYLAFVAAVAAIK